MKHDCFNGLNNHNDNGLMFYKHWLRLMGCQSRSFQRILNIFNGISNFHSTRRASQMNSWDSKSTNNVSTVTVLQFDLHGPLARYVQLRVAHAPGMPGTFFPSPRVSDLDRHYGTCVILYVHIIRTTLVKLVVIFLRFLQVQVTIITYVSVTQYKPARFRFNLFELSHKIISNN